VLHPLWGAPSIRATGFSPDNCDTIEGARGVAAFICAVYCALSGKAADRLGKLVVVAGAAERFLKTPM